jgi:F-type H+-transporting ATPase subunit delta
LASDAPSASASTLAPNPTGVAERYARALLALADEKRAGGEAGALDRIGGDLDRLFELWRNEAAFRAFVADPRLGAAAQQSAAFAVIEQAGIGTEVRNLVGVLIVNRRLAALPQVAGAFGALLAERRGQQRATVISAHPLSATQVTALVARLTEAGYPSVQLEQQVQPEILGGLILRLGSRLYDTSIKSKLQRLQYAMKGAA